MAEWQRESQYSPKRTLLQFVKDHMDKARKSLEECEGKNLKHNFFFP